MDSNYHIFKKKITIAKIAGHSSINMTVHYTRADISGMVTAIQPASDADNELFK